MGKKYKIVVDGVEHLVEVEDYNGATHNVQKTTETINVSPKIETTTADVETTKTVSASANSVLAPLQGNLQDLKVSVGQSVKAGDVLVIIEAMKMENEIVAPKDGKVSAIHCQKGTKVNNGDPLVDIV